MGLLRLLLLVAAVALLAWLFWPLLRRLGAWVDASQQTEPPKLIPLERSPFEILGLEDGASRFEVERAWRQILAENAPEKVAGLSPEVQAAAARRCEEATRARERILERE